jgi:Mn2+/Fe2+ NRAMP family transporter
VTNGTAGSAGSAGTAGPTRLRVLLGAAFLMATSAIGPGFLTQTVVFTERLGASFAFAILVSVVVDLAAQLNIWRVLIAARAPAQTVANRVFPGLGHFIAVLVALGGLAFNIGNVAGAGLGLDALLGLDVKAGAAISAALAVALFLSRDAGRAMDRFAQGMGAVMIVLACYVAFASHPPVGEAALRTVVPMDLDALAIITIVGGTVGGYITFAGAHRLLDAGVAGPAAVGQATRSAGLGIGVATLMRIMLFLAALGIVSQGLALDPANPPASVFRLAAGQVGYRLFGAVMWAAAMSSIVGSAYTSVTFIRTLRPTWERHTAALIIGFIVISTIVFLGVGRPVAVLILVGALNGLILPVGLAAMLVASRRPALLNGYTHSGALALGGAVVAIAMAALGVYTLVTEVPGLLR